MAPKRLTTTSSREEKKKKKKKKRTNNAPDLISELPDRILHKILSFLDIKYVIPTSFLSRRWRYLWTSLPFINISEDIYNRCKKPVEPPDYDDIVVSPSKIYDLTDFVDSMLLMRNHTSNIHTFRFSNVPEDFDYEYKRLDDDILLGHIYMWILFLIRSNIEVLDLHIVTGFEKLDLPPCLFNCESLTTLKLVIDRGDFDESDIGDFDETEPPKFNLPTKLVMSLPALKILHIRFLSIIGDIGKLISSCPVLETLIISKCIIDMSGKQLTISASQLKNLVIEEMRDESSSKCFEYCKLKVFAPKLASFTCREFSSMSDYSFVDNSSLENATIESDDQGEFSYFFDDGLTKSEDQQSRRKQNYFKHLIKCLSGIHNVRSLTLSAWLLKVIIEGRPANCCTSLPFDTFCNLRLLKLKTALSRQEIQGIACLFENCPNLETLVLKMTESESLLSKSREEQDGWEADELAPHCMMDHLKLVEIWDVLPSVNEIEFLKFLLKSATILKKMIVHAPKKQSASNDMKLKTFGEKLRTFPAVSSVIEILSL